MSNKQKLELTWIGKDKHCRRDGRLTHLKDVAGFIRKKRWRRKSQREISGIFDSEEALLDTLTGNRFAMLKALAGAEPLGVRELARRVHRDVRAVHADARRLAGSA